MIYYMNIETGSIGEYNDWFYWDDSGAIVNAVDNNEVVQVKYENGIWIPEE